MLSVIAVENYRSLRDLVVPLARLNVVTGRNGTGKSSVYRALRLLAESSRNGAVAALAREGGLASTLWAGPEVVGRAVRDGEHAFEGTVRQRPVRLRLGFAGDDFGYAVEFGLPAPAGSLFDRDPEIKAETIWAGPLPRPAAVLSDRRGGVVRVRDDDMKWRHLTDGLRPFDSMLSEVADPQVAPELFAVRENIRSWRFYDHFRTDAASPARTPRVATRTPVLGHDGADLAAALQTIREIGDADALDSAIEDAFPGSRIAIEAHAGHLEVRLHQHALLRPLGTAELSDGTLRYLLWAAALLTPRPPELMVLNEPETSLHPDLLEPLAGLIARAAARVQIVVVTHAAPLVAALRSRAADVDTDLSCIELEKDMGQTRVRGHVALSEVPVWQWPRH